MRRLACTSVKRKLLKYTAANSDNNNVFKGITMKSADDKPNPASVLEDKRIKEEYIAALLCGSKACSRPSETMNSATLTS
ncbi:MAG: hypothetical protein P4M11_11290, partial [Candidatus Pacebacteria bacterium]|nr:hypothetical protein [Candidatus Paceibacterota bacterium]